MLLGRGALPCHIMQLRHPVSRHVCLSYYAAGIWISALSYSVARTGIFALSFYAARTWISALSDYASMRGIPAMFFFFKLLGYGYLARLITGISARSGKTCQTQEPCLQKIFCSSLVLQKIFGEKSLYNRIMFECPTPTEWGTPGHRSWLCSWLFISDVSSLLIGCDESCDIS